MADGVTFDFCGLERTLDFTQSPLQVAGLVAKKVELRSLARTQRFCRIRGDLSTLQKLGQNNLDALVELFLGNPQ